MKKHLILVLTLAFVVGISFGAYAEVQNVKIGGDLTVYGISRNMNLKGNKNDATESTMASITRINVSADLTDNVMATVRLLNERYWGTENANVGITGQANSDISLDLAYVTLKEFLYSPLSLTIGRQELHFGSEMIIGDYDTNNMVTTASPFGADNRDKDMSARKAFDAIRATLNYDPLVVDIVVAKVSNTNLNTKDDVTLSGINANYKLSAKTTVEGYWFEKRSGKAYDATGTTVSSHKKDLIETVGARVVTSPIENLIYSLELAYQFGQRATGVQNTPAVVRKAWALETYLSYNWKNIKYTPSTTILYSYFSGDHLDANNHVSNSNGAYRGWDPMFENQKTGDIANALFNQSNAHVFGGVISVAPAEDITLKGEYYAYWWAKAYREGDTIAASARNSAANLIMTQKRYAGQECDLTATYAYTEDVQFGLLGGLFFPGSSFNRTNHTLSTELIGSMKITF